MSPRRSQILMVCRWPRTSLALRRHRQSQASGLDELDRLIVVRIQVVDGVTRTLTCMVLHR